MEFSWAVGVLRDGAENVAELAAGAEPAAADAWDAAIDALVRAAAAGRQEYRVTVDGHEVIVMPGLDEDGQVDLEALDHALRTQAERFLAP